MGSFFSSSSFFSYSSFTLPTFGCKDNIYVFLLGTENAMGGTHGSFAEYAILFNLSLELFRLGPCCVCLVITCAVSLSRLLRVLTRLIVVWTVWTKHFPSPVTFADICHNAAGTGTGNWIQQTNFVPIVRIQSGLVTWNFR